MIQPSNARAAAVGRNKQPHDTAVGCRAFAQADLARATVTQTERGRAKFEHSAATWQARGDMLQRLDESHEARVAAAR